MRRSSRRAGWLVVGLAVMQSVFLAVMAASDFTLAGAPATVWFDEQSRALRLLHGPAGAARAGSAVVTEVDFASVSPSGNTAVIRQGEDWTWVEDVAHAMRGFPVQMPAGTVRIGWAGQARCAAIYSEQQVAVWTLCGGGGAPRLAGPLPLGAGFTGLDTLEMSADGRSVACIAWSETGAWLLLAQNLSGWRTLESLPGGGAAVFGRRSGTLLLVDQARNRLLEIAIEAGHPAGALRTVELAAEQARVTGILESAGGDRVLLLEQGRRLALYSFTGGLLRHQELETPVARLVPAGPGRSLGLPGEPRDPLQLFDLTRDEIVFFVPDPH